MSISIPSPALGQPDIFDRLMNEVVSGRDVSIIAPDGAADALLDKATRSLAIQDSRVFRMAATASDGLSIARMVAEVTGRLERAQQDDRVLEEAFNNLTVLDGTCERIVLLVSGAEALQRSTLRYLQFIMQVGPRLQVVFAGAPGFLTALGTYEFAPLHARLTARAAIMLDPASPIPVSLPRRVGLGRYGVLAGCGAAMAACIAFAGWSLRYDPGPAHAQQAAVRPDALPGAAGPALPAPLPAPLPVPAPAPVAAPVPPGLATPPAAPVLPAPAAPGLMDAAPPVRSADSDPRDSKVRLEALSAELEAARHQSRRTAAVARRSPRAAILAEPLPAPPDIPPRPPAESQEAAADKRERLIGSYTTDANGVRAFRASQQ